MRKNQFFMILSGMLVGILTGYLRAFSPMSFWCFSDLAARYGFWILTVSMIGYFSGNRRKAMVNSLLYMITMCIFYYGYLYVDKGVLYIRQFVFWVLFSVFAAFYASLINKEKYQQMKYGFLIKCIPILLLVIEFVDTMLLFVGYRTNFMQMLIDFSGVVVLSVLFMRKKGE